MSYAVEVLELKKSYGEFTVLRDLDFKVYKGEIFALLGVNGAGKTTALESMEGLRSYDSGSIKVHGKMGIQLQSSSLPAYIRPMEAIKLFSKWNHSRIDYDMLNALGISEISKKNYLDLSTGQKRRLHLALSLVSNPDIVFLDEPTAGLDVEGRISLHEIIRKLKSLGKTIILSSHDMVEVETLCDRIGILSEGKLIYIGTVSELTNKVRANYNISIKTSVGEESFETIDIGDTMLTVLKDYKDRGITVLDIKIDTGTLEQHFIEIARGNRE